jgi:hypothetical protein
MQSLKLTIITPTLLRPSLVEACKSVDDQFYVNWTHIVVVDNPKASIQDYISTHPGVVNPKRLWFQCKVNHHNVGNTCRNEVYEHIPPDTDYILYLDDDNSYFLKAFEYLVTILKAENLPAWGTFPIIRFGKLFLDKIPRTNYVDTGQIYHKPVINGLQIKYPPLDDYAGDGKLAEYLTSLTPPVVLDRIPPILNLSVRSFGAPVPPSKDTTPYTVLIPNKYEDVIRPLISSLRQTEPRLRDVIVLGDCHSNSFGYKNITLDSPFI